MTERSPGINIELTSEIATSDKPAKVDVYNGNNLIATIEANLVPEKGADGGLYDVIKLREISPPLPES